MVKTRLPTLKWGSMHNLVGLRPLLLDSVHLWCLGSFKILECVPRLCQLGSQGLPRGSSSHLGIFEARIQEGAVFWKPLRHVCQPHHPNAHHRACTPEPSHLWADQPGDAEGTSVQAQPHPRHCAVPHMQHSAAVQDLTSEHTSHSWASVRSIQSPEYRLEKWKHHVLDTDTVMRLPNSCDFSIPNCPDQVKGNYNCIYAIGRESTQMRRWLRFPISD